MDYIFWICLILAFSTISYSIGEMIGFKEGFVSRRRYPKTRDKVIPTNCHSQILNQNK